MKPLTARGLLPIRGRRVGGSAVVCRFAKKRPERVRICTSNSIIRTPTNGKFKCLSPSNLFPSRPPFRLMSLSSAMSLPRHIGALPCVSPISSDLHGCSRLREFAAAMRCVRLNGISNHWVGQSGATPIATALASCLSTPLTKLLMPRASVLPRSIRWSPSHRLASLRPASKRGPLRVLAFAPMSSVSRYSVSAAPAASQGSRSLLAWRNRALAALCCWLQSKSVQSLSDSIS